MNSLEEFVKQAVAGDKKALETVVNKIQNDIYNLAVRMLWHPDDAEDATQDILIKIITNLGKFKHKSAFKTWVYRIAYNALINFKKKKKFTISFNEFENELKQGFSNTITYSTNKAEHKLLIQEAKIGCSNAMLQCLNEGSRFVYIIGEILEFDSKEAAIILNISPDNFRQKLSRTRKKLHSFINNNCGIVNPKNICRCNKKVDSSVKKGIIQPNKLLFSNNRRASKLIESIDVIESEVALFQTNPQYSIQHKMFDKLINIDL